MTIQLKRDEDNLFYLKQLLIIKKQYLQKLDLKKELKDDWRLNKQLRLVENKIKEKMKIPHEKENYI